MTDSTFDLARRCPVCEELGLAVGTRPAEAGNRRAGLLHIFRCENTRCKRHGRDWIVQVRADGTIPEPTLNREKSFPMEKGTAKSRIERARSNVDGLVKETLEK